MQERRQAARVTAKEGDAPHHDEREEEHDPQGEDRDGGELALLLTDADHLQTGGQDVHQFVDEESCEERRQYMEAQHEEECPTGHEPGSHIIRKGWGMIV